MSSELLIRSPASELYGRALLMAWRAGIRIYDPSLAQAREPDIEAKLFRDADIAMAVKLRQHLIAGQEWYLEPASDSDLDKAAAQVLKGLVEKIQGFSQARHNLSRAFLSGQRFASMQGESKALKLGDGVERKWNVVTRLIDHDKRRFRWVPERHSDGSYTARLEVLSITKGDWKPVEHPSLLVKHTYDDSEETMGHGRGLREALYWWWYAKEHVFRESLQAVERFGQGILTAKINGAKDANGMPNTELVTAWRDALKAMRAEHVLVFDSADEVDVKDMAGSGWQLLTTMREELRTTCRVLILGANLTTGGGDKGGSYALASIQENSTDALVHFDRETLEETLTEDLLGYLWRANAHNLRDLGLEGAEMPRFKIKGEKKQDAKTFAEVLAAAQAAGLAVVEEEAYAGLGLTPPKDGDSVIEPPSQGGPPPGAGGFPGGGPGGPPPPQPGGGGGSILDGLGPLDRLRQAPPQAAPGGPPGPGGAPPPAGPEDASGAQDEADGADGGGKGLERPPEGPKRAGGRPGDVLPATDLVPRFQAGPRLRTFQRAGVTIFRRPAPKVLPELARVRLARSEAATRSERVLGSLSVFDVTHQPAGAAGGKGGQFAPKEGAEAGGSTGPEKPSKQPAAVARSMEVPDTNRIRTADVFPSTPVRLTEDVDNGAQAALTRARSGPVSVAELKIADLVPVQRTVRLDRVLQILQDPKSGGEAPPLVALWRGRRLLIDGTHRTAAAHVSGARTIKAQVIQIPDSVELLDRSMQLPGPLSTFEFNEADHPRGDDGKFIPKEDIAAAAGDPAKQAALRERVKDPKERAKLDRALEAHAATPSEQAPAAVQDATPEAPPASPGKPAKPRDPRLPAVGEVVAKQWRGYQVKVRADENGFTLLEGPEEHKGASFKSLSALASTLTGVSTNGVLWLGAAKKIGPKGKEEPKPPEREPLNVPVVRTQPTDAKGKVVRPNPTIHQIPTDQIHVDPARFQFKRDTSSVTGAGDQFRDVDQWDPVAAGVVLAWRDRDGKLWVADGHHRVELGKRLGAPHMNAFILDEAEGVTHQMARATAALRNIKDGKGTALDAGKALRDLGWTVEDLKREGVSPRSALARDGMGIAGLSEPVYNLVVDDMIPQAYAGEIGRELRSETQQRMAAAAIADASSFAQVQSVVRQIRNAPEHSHTEQTLWGEDTFSKSLFLERAKVEEALGKRLREDKNLFRTLSTKAQKAQRVEGTTINREGSEKEAGAAAELALTLSAYGDKVGPVKEALDEAARAYADSPRKAQHLTSAVDKLLERLRGIDSLTGEAREVQPPDPAGGPGGLFGHGAGAALSGPEGVAFEFREADHPRGDDGRFIRKDEIAAAAKDPKKARELMARVTDPAERRKLGHALAEHGEHADESGDVLPSATAGSDPRVPPPGSLISRTWRGIHYQVEVLKDGFRLKYGKDELSDQTFPTLTALTKAITGAKSINGVVWWGLGKKQVDGGGGPKPEAPKPPVEKPAPPTRGPGASHPEPHREALEREGWAKNGDGYMHGSGLELQGPNAREVMNILLRNPGCLEDGIAAKSALAHMGIAYSVDISAEPATARVHATAALKAVAVMRAQGAELGTAHVRSGKPPRPDYAGWFCHGTPDHLFLSSRAKYTASVPRQLDRSYSYPVPRAFTWGGASMVSTTMHEMGHRLHYKAASGVFRALMSSKSDDGEKRGTFSWANDAEALGVLKQAWREKQISTYGSSNPHEFVAEIFARRCLGGHVSEPVMELYRGYGGVELPGWKKQQKEV